MVQVPMVTGSLLRMECIGLIVSRRQAKIREKLRVIESRGSIRETILFCQSLESWKPTATQLKIDGIPHKNGIPFILVHMFYFVKSVIKPV